MHKQLKTFNRGWPDVLSSTSLLCSTQILPQAIRYNLHLLPQLNISHSEHFLARIFLHFLGQGYLWDQRNDDDWCGKGDTVCQGAIKNPAVSTNLTIAQHCHIHQNVWFSINKHASLKAVHMC